MCSPASELVINSVGLLDLYIYNKSDEQERAILINTLRWRKLGQEFVKAYSLTQSILNYKHQITSLLSKFKQITNWRSAVMLIDLLTRILMLVSIRETSA